MRSRRRRSTTPSVDLQLALGRALAGTHGVRWSACLRGQTNTFAVHNESQVLSTASIGKLVLLVEVARRAELDPAFLDARLDRNSASPVADSGLWQRLHVDALDVHDLATLVASTSDNLATNVLLAHVGVESVAEIGRSLGLRSTALLDIVRNERDETMSPTLSQGCARELADLMAHMAAGRLLTEHVSNQLAEWMSLNTDLSMVASAFGLDPLAHSAADAAHHGVRVQNKTGTDIGVRADVGHVTGPDGAISYAVLANFAPSDPALPETVLTAMREIGRLLQESVTAT